MSVDAEPGSELRKFLRTAERRRSWAAFLRAAPRCLAWIAASALALVLVFEARGTRVDLPIRVQIALGVIAGASAYAVAAARRARSVPTARWLDERMGTDGLLETAAEMGERPARFAALCVRSAERALARERASALIPLETPRLGLSLGLLAVLVLSALLPPLGIFGHGSRGLGEGSGEATVGRASGGRREGGAGGSGSASSNPASKPSEGPSPTKTPKAPASKPAPTPPSNPEPIPPFTPTPKFIPIDPRGSLTSKRETQVVELPEPETFGARPSASPRPVPLDAPRVEALRRAAERALSLGALDPDERAFVARYFEILAR